MRGPPGERSVPELLSFGVVNLDKPPGPSAHEVAGWVRDACDDALASGELPGSDGDSEGAPPELGGAAHGGTLDPKVTGCLPTLLGDATRIARVLHRGTKGYVAVLQLHAAPPPDLDAVVEQFEGALYQKPPRKSAVKRDLRVREVYDLEVLEVADRQALLRIECEAGTYIRKLCHDLGLALGTGAHMGDLRRIETTPFGDSDLVTLEELVDALAYAQEDGASGTTDGDGGAGRDGDAAPIDVRDVVEPAERALEHVPGVTIAESAARAVADGAPVYAPGVLAAADELDQRVEAGDGAAALGAGNGDDGDAPLVACYTPDGAVVCLGRLVGDPTADEGVVVSLERVLM